MAIKFLDEKPSGKVKFLDEQGQTLTPTEQATEEKIGERKSSLNALLKQVKSDTILAAAVPPQFSLESASESGEFMVNLLGTHGQLTESPFANIAIAMQTKTPEEITAGASGSGIIGAIGSDVRKTKEFAGILGEDFHKGATGERIGEYGDIYRNLGMPEPVAASLGFITAVVLDPTQIKQFPFKKLGETFQETGKKLGRAMSKGRHVTKDIKGVSGLSGELISIKKGKPIRNYDDIGKQLKKAKNERYQIISEKNRIQSEISINDIQKETDSLMRELDENAGIDALNMQDKLRQWGKNNREIYGDYIDSISESLKKGNQEILLGEIEEFANNTMQQVVNETLPQGKSFEAISAFSEKYSSFGQGLKKAKKLGLQEVLNDEKKVKNTIKKDVNTGKLDPDSISGEIFRKNFSEFLNGRVPGWKELNSKYGEVISLENKAGSIFQQNKGKYFTEKGEKFIKDVAEDAISQGEKSLVEDIEKGVEGFAEGIGDFTKRERRISEKIAKNTASIEEIKEFNRIRKRTLAKGKKESLGKIDQRLLKAKKINAQQKGAIIKNASTQIAKYGAYALVYELFRRDFNSIIRGDSTP